MINLSDIVERIKDTITKAEGEKVFDKDVAAVLGVGQINLSKQKSRNAIPYQEIFRFCLKHNYSASYIFLGLGKQRINKDDPRKYLVTIKEL